MLAQQDFTRLGWPQEQQIRDLQLESYDLLIDLNVSQLLPLRYLVFYARADFRCGMLTPKPCLADMQIDLTHVQAPEAAPERAENKTAAEVVDSAVNPAYLFDQILHYLQTIEEK